MRRFALVLVFALAGCGGSEPLTNEQVEDMSDEEAVALLDCQMREAAEDLGQQETIDRYSEALIGSAENGGDTLQVILDGDGYRCPLTSHRPGILHNYAGEVASCCKP